MSKPIMQLKPVLTTAVKQAIKTKLVRLEWVTVKDLRRLIDAGYSVIINGK